TPCRFHDATDALKEVLATIKKDAYVSVMIFSQQVKGGQPKASETITVLREPKRWDPAEMPDLMEELEKLVPFNDTPLVRAMAKAKQKCFPDDFTGLKSLVVLTDGKDTEFEGDAELNPGGRLSIPAFIEQTFGDAGILVNVVGFKVPNK